MNVVNFLITVGAHAHKSLKISKHAQYYGWGLDLWCASFEIRTLFLEYRFWVHSYAYLKMALQNSGRGYPVKFVEPPPKQIPVDCSICFDVLFQPKMVSCCDHSFCAACIGRVERDNKPCPLCGQAFSLTDDKRLVRTLNDFNVYCPHQERGCEWIGELGDVESHLNQNPESDKLLKGCQFQELQCGLCQLHNCERRRMTDHVSTQCPNRDIECEYLYAGCNFKKPQQQLEFHGREAVSLHLSLVANLVQGSLSQKDEEVEELREKLNRQREQCSMQIQELKQQHTELQRLSEKKFKTFREELRRERRANHDRHWIVLLLLMMTGGIIHAYLYQLDFSRNDSNMKETDIELSNLSFHQQLLKELFMNSRMNVSNLTKLYNKVQELETGFAQINSNIWQMETKLDSVIGELRQEISSTLVQTKEKVRENVLNEIQALSDFSETNAKDLRNLKSTYNISTTQIKKSLENVKKQIVTIKRCNCNDSTLNNDTDEFVRINSEIQYLGLQVNFPSLPVYLNMSNVRGYNDSKSGWLSSPFYTHQEGYRMRLVVYPNGRRSGAGTHVSVAVYLMSGKHDHKLDWPLNMTLNVTLVNQRSEDKDSIGRLFDCSISAYDIESLDRVWNSTMAKTGMMRLTLCSTSHCSCTNG